MRLFVFACKFIAFLEKVFWKLFIKMPLNMNFKKRGIQYEREKKYKIEYKDIILPHHFYADFVVYDKIILEIKAQQGIVENHYKWVINYLSVSKCKLGLIVNFGDNSLVTKRLIL